MERKSKRASGLLGQVENLAQQYRRYIEDQVDPEELPQAEEEERRPPSALLVRDFIENHCKILDESGNLVSPILRPAQEKIHEACETQRERTGMVRLLIGKFRKPGASTYVQLRFLCHQINNANITSALVAHRDDSTRWISQFAIRAYMNLSEEIRERAPISRDIPAKTGLSFAPPFQGQFISSTAGGRGFGHGVTPQLVHLSEVAWFPQSADFMVGLGNSLRNVTGSEIIQESTFNGRDPFFYPEWQRARNGESEYEALFLGLLDEEKAFPFYSIPLEPGEKLKLRPDEADLQRKYNVPDALMKFIMLKKNSPACLYRWDRFHQQFPLVEELAFSSESAAVFSAADLDWQEAENVRDPNYQAGIRFLNREPLSPVEINKDDPEPLFEIWEEPQPGEHYVISFDVAEGFGGDFSVMSAWKVGEGTLEQVAHYATNQVPHHDSGVHCFMLGEYFNWALIIVEANNFGAAVLNCLERSFDPYIYPQTTMGYPHLYRAVKMEKAGDPEITDRIGWLTNRKSKQKMIMDLAGHILNRTIIIRSPRTLMEMRGFFWDSERNNYVQTNISEDGKHHDDEIMSAALAPQAIQAEKLGTPIFERAEIVNL
jgi:hypothetical protein